MIEVLHIILLVIAVVNSVLVAGVLIMMIAVGGEFQKVLKLYQDGLEKSQRWFK